MKVLFLVDIAYPYRVKFFNELGKLYDLTVVFEARTSKERNTEWLKARPTNFHAVYLNGLGDPYRTPRFGVLKWIGSNAFDMRVLVGYHTPTAMLAIEYLRVRRIPFILNTDGGFIKSDTRSRAAVKRHFITAASAWLSPTQPADDYLIHYGAQPGRVFRYVFSGMSTADIPQDVPSRADVAALRHELGLTESRVILAVGQFIHRKGFDVLLDAAAQFDKTIGIYLIGGRASNSLAEQKRRLGLEHVHFVDFMPPNDLQAYYRAADLLVLPTREDIWGMVIVEALAQGLPVVSTNKCLAALELVGHGKNGFIVPVDDAGRLADALRAVFTDATRERMSLAALESVREYTVEAMVESHCAAFEAMNGSSTGDFRA